MKEAERKVFGLRIGRLLECIYNSFTTGNDFGGYNEKEPNSNLAILYHF